MPYVIKLVLQLLPIGRIQVFPKEGVQFYAEVTFVNWIDVDKFKRYLIAYKKAYKNI